MTPIDLVLPQCGLVAPTNPCICLFDFLAATGEQVSVVLGLLENQSKPQLKMRSIQFISLSWKYVENSLIIFSGAINMIGCDVNNISLMY